MMPLAARVQVIGHRGAPAHFPEHTRASYERAIVDGADFVEPDLVMTRDGVLVSRHENEIGTTTDVASHPEFAGRRTTRRIEGQRVEGWFTEDFTLTELKTLRARERLPDMRSTRHDGRYPILTLDEIIELVATASARIGRPIGIIPEIKHGTYFRSLGLPMEDRLLDTFAAHLYTRNAPLEIQSFEVGNLRYLHERLGGAQARERHPNIRLLQLLGAPEQQPRDIRDAHGTQTYAGMMTPVGLRQIASYADAIGPSLDAVIPRNADDDLGAPTALVGDAHAAGLEVQPWTFRPENRYLARRFRDGDVPGHRHAAGLEAQIGVFLDAGIDAFFTDDPAIGRRAVDNHPPRAG
jgi:glycerophosphoryl diester phosphodiesterase